MFYDKNRESILKFPTVVTCSNYLDYDSNKHNDETKWWRLGPHVGVWRLGGQTGWRARRQNSTCEKDVASVRNPKGNPQ